MDGEMTIRVPIWALVVIGVVVIAVGGFLIGRFTGDGDDSSNPSSPSASEPADEADETAPPPLPCNKRAAVEAIAASEPETFLRTWFSVPPEVKVEKFFMVERVYCQELTADGMPEMVPQLVAGASGGATPWIIFTQEDGEWQDVFLREGPGNERIARVSGGGIRTSTPVYAIGDALCCPTGERRGSVRYIDSEFSFIPQTGTEDRAITVSRDGEVNLGGLDIQTTDPADATDNFGLATSTVRDEELCEVEWADIGLTLRFANFGGANPCSSQGAVGSALLQGPAAELAGWRTEQGLSVGASLEEMLELYPEARTNQGLSPDPRLGVLGRGFVLKAKPSIIGQGTRAPSLIARVQNGAVVGIELQVGAAGD